MLNAFVPVNFTLASSCRVSYPWVLFVCLAGIVLHQLSKGRAWSTPGEFFCTSFWFQDKRRSQCTLLWQPLPYYCSTALRVVSLIVCYSNRDKSVVIGRVLPKPVKLCYATCNGRCESIFQPLQLLHLFCMIEDAQLGMPSFGCFPFCALLTSIVTSLFFCAALTAGVNCSSAHYGKKYGEPLWNHHHHWSSFGTIPSRIVLEVMMGGPGHTRNF